MTQPIHAQRNSPRAHGHPLEGKDFTDPARILITALGTEENTGQRWTDNTRTSLGRNWGSAPVRVEGVRGLITLPVSASRVNVWALDERGNRREPVKVAGEKEAEIEIGPQYRAVWYEVEVR